MSRKTNRQVPFGSPVLHTEHLDLNAARIGCFLERKGLLQRMEQLPIIAILAWMLRKWAAESTAGGTRLPTALPWVRSKVAKCLPVNLAGL